MLSLDDERWGELRSSPGGTGELARALIRDALDGQLSALDELLHQVCHQLTVGEVAYAAVPYLVEIARRRGSRDALAIIGAVVAGRAAQADSPPVPEDLVDAYEASLVEARSMVAERLAKDEPRSHDGTSSLIAALAALTGQHNLAMLLFTGEGADLSCPECGELIDFMR